MNQNRTVFDIDEETDAFYLQKAVEYHEWLIQQEAQPRLTRTPIFRDREDAERRLRADYFDDHSAIRQMAYGSTPDAFDEYLQMSEHTARDALFFFNMCIIELYMPKYLRKPTLEDVCHGKVNTVGVIKKYPTIMLEAVASQDLWIWHAFYGMTGANNDINVLDNSSLFDDLLDDLAHVVPYVVNGVEYRNGARKDVERAFGVLQGRWGLFQQSARAYEVNTLRRIMYAGIIMHNMILEDQNMSVVDMKHVYSNPARSMQTVWIDRCETQRRKAKELRDKDTHISLQQNLMNHIWREVEEASEED
ncbi:ALP1-like protein isoform X1 [Tanacetum coccineum]